ncbi:MAG: hypothetical protein R2880_19855 [Deinococcales bacterium]
MRFVPFFLTLLSLAILALIFKDQLSHALIWFKVEAPQLKSQLIFSLWRFAKAFLIANLLGLALGLLIRHIKAIEALLSPWLLSALALPWLVMILLINMISPLSKGISLWLGIAGSLTAIAYGFRPLANAKILKSAFLTGYRLLFFAILIAEMLGSDNGIGAQIRFFFLFWNPGRLVAYGLIIVILWLVVELLSRLASFLISRYMMTSKGKVASPRSPA